MKKSICTMNKSCILLLSSILILGLTMVTTGCAPGPEIKPIETEADIIGFITGIHESMEKGLPSQIDVESHANKIVTQYAVTIKDDTLIFQQNVGDISKVSFAAFKAKQWVKIWFSGPVIEDQEPLHATALQVIIDELKPYKED